VFPAEVDPSNLAETGWAVVVPADSSPAILPALEPLLEVRRGQAGKLFRVLEYWPGDDAKAFLNRHRTSKFPTSVTEVPGYLLLVDDPTRISFSMQVLLGLGRGVGRLAFKTIDEYANYARAAAKRETAANRGAGRVVLFSPGAANEPPLEGADTRVLEPLLTGRHLAERAVDTLAGESATKQRLAEAIRRGPTPDLLVTITQSLVFPPAHTRQRTQQGCLLCAPAATNTVGTGLSDRAWSSSDIEDDDDLRGLISLHVGSFCAGTERLDSLAVQMFKEQLLLAPEPFISALAQRQLGHSRPSLAVIGQTDRLTLCGPADTRWVALGLFVRDFVNRVLRGSTVGHALMTGSKIWAQAATDLALKLEDAALGATVDHAGIASAWVNKQAFGSFILLGDPAVRLVRADRLNEHVSQDL
jgi:hypothetical protein